MAFRPQQESGAPSPRQPQRRRRLTKVLLLTASLLVLLIGGGIAWYLGSPLFLYNTGNDTNLLARTPSVASTPGTTSTPASTGPVVLATGAFVDNIHKDDPFLALERGSGKVTVGKAVHGQYLIHLDEMDIANGPDLHVYLAPTRESIDAGKIIQEGVDLGPLKATKGSLNVAIPTDIGTMLPKYQSVVIVCKLASTVFTYAPLTFS